MKKFCVLLLALCLWLPAPILASETAEPAAVPRVSFGAIPELILAGSPVVKINRHTVAVMEYNLELLDQGEIRLGRGISAVDDQIQAMQATLATLPAGDADPGVNAALTGVRALYQMNIMSLGMTYESSMGQILTTEDGKTDLARTIEQVICQTDLVNQQMVTLAENLYFAYHAAGQQQAELTAQLALLQRQLTILRLQVKLGMAAPSAADGLSATLAGLENGLSTLATARTNIVGNLNLLLGREADLPLMIEAPPLLPASPLDPLNREADLATATEASYAIRLQEYTYQAKKVALGRIDIETDEKIAVGDPEIEEYSDEPWYEAYRKAEQELLAEQEKLSQEERTLRSQYDQCVIAVETKRAALVVETEKLRLAEISHAQDQTRFTLGLLSRLKMEAATAALATQQRATQAAEWGLLQAYRAYERMLQGMPYAPAGASGSGI